MLDGMDGLVHQHVLAAFVERGFAPSVAELSAALSASASEIEACLRRLHAAPRVVLSPNAAQ